MAYILDRAPEDSNIALKKLVEFSKNFVIFW